MIALHVSCLGLRSGCVTSSGQPKEILLNMINAPLFYSRSESATLLPTVPTFVYLLQLGSVMGLSRFRGPRELYNNNNNNNNNKIIGTPLITMGNTIALVSMGKIIRHTGRVTRTVGVWSTVYGVE